MNKISLFVPVKLEVDFIEFLNSTQKEVLENMIKAAKYMSPIYERQVFLRNPDIRKRLIEESRTSPLAKAKLEYFDIMIGPWDRLNNSEPFAIETPKPRGGGFYPEESFEQGMKRRSKKDCCIEMPRFGCKVYAEMDGYRKAECHLHLLPLDPEIPHHFGEYIIDEHQ